MRYLAFLIVMFNSLLWTAYGETPLYINIVSNAEVSLRVYPEDVIVQGAIWQSTPALEPQPAMQLPGVYGSGFLPEAIYPTIIIPSEASIDPNIYIEFIGHLGKFYSE